MEVKDSLSIHILEYCQNDFRPITPLIDKAAPRSTLYRCKQKLLEKGLLEANGKDQYKITPQGFIQLETVKGEAPKDLSFLYPPLKQVPTPQHRAAIELTIASVIARKYKLREDRHPTIIIAGPTLTWKTSLGVFICYMLGLDHSTHIVNLEVESGKSLWLRKNSTGKITYKRELLDTSLVVFDEYQAADSDCKRLLKIWIDGRTRVAFENDELTIEPVTILTLNPSAHETLEKRFGISRAQLRRSIICDLTDSKLGKLALKGEDIIKAAKAQGPIKLQKPKDDCSPYKQKLYELFNSTLNKQGRELVDLETLTMLSTAMTAYLETEEAIRLIFYDVLLLFEKLGWTQPGWTIRVRNFPEVMTEEMLSNKYPDPKSITHETFVKGFKHLEAGSSPSELVTKLDLTVEEANHITKKYNELRRSDSHLHKEKNHNESVEDKYLRKLDFQLQIAQKKNEITKLEKTIDTSNELTELNMTIDHMGSYKKKRCSHMIDNYCRYWSWREKPKILYQIGEPLLKDGNWYIHPTDARCAICHSHNEQGAMTKQDIQYNIGEIWKAINYISFSIHQISQRSVQEA